VSGGHKVRAARVLVDTDDGLIEETIAALTWEMAIDVAQLMFGTNGLVLGVQEGVNRHWVIDVADEFFDRSDLPVGWDRSY
jgi:hypothetical protein